MSNCAVACCKNYSRVTKGSNIKYFRFPKDVNLTKQWIIACRRQDKINLKNARICSVHFEDNCFEVPLKERLLNYEKSNSRHLRLDAVPTLNLLESLKRPQQFRKERISRKRRHEEQNILKASVMKTKALELETPSVSKEASSVFKETDSCVENKTEMIELRNKIKILVEQNNDLRIKLKEAEKSTEQKYEAILSKVFTKGKIKKLSMI